MTPIETDIGAWPSMKAAAKAYGVSVYTIEYHLNRGTLDRIGKRSLYHCPICRAWHLGGKRKKIRRA